MTTIQQAAAALGRIKSQAKTKAARENGKKGGRPRKAPFDIPCHVEVRDGCPDEIRKAMEAQ